MTLLTRNDNGIFCPDGDFYIDPWRPVARALITHAHADHARRGMGAYLATEPSVPILRSRLGSDIAVEGVAWGERRLLGGISVSFHPAGHVPGSAQIRVERGGEVWVVTGDFKRQFDPIVPPFEPVRCHTLISESTFGLPIFSWESRESVFDDMARWIGDAHRLGEVPVVLCYALGKAQSIFHALTARGVRVLAHGAIAQLTTLMQQHRELFSPLAALPPIERVTRDREKITSSPVVVLAPPSVMGSRWLSSLGTVSVANASGWMALRGVRRRGGFDRGFVLSDHADFAGLLNTVRESGAEQVYFTHGYSEIMARYLTERGTPSTSLDVEAYEGEGGDGEVVLSEESHA